LRFFWVINKKAQSEKKKAKKRTFLKKAQKAHAFFCALLASEQKLFLNFELEGQNVVVAARETPETRP